MKKLLLALLCITLALVGCGIDSAISSNQQTLCEELNNCETTTTTAEITTAELLRFRVKVVEITCDDDDGEPCVYVVRKDGYTVDGIYTLETEQTFQLNEILYVIITNEYTAVPFSEWWWEHNQ